MKNNLRIIFAFLSLFLMSNVIYAKPKPVVEIKTNMGSFVVELNHRRSPTTVANFLYYVKKDYYAGTIFHRVISDFMIQGGGFDTDFRKKPTRSPIRNESTNGLENKVGTIAMARTNDVDSATSQFYVNVKDNRSLNASYGSPGYTVFGNVIEGMDVVMRIAQVPVQSLEGVGNDVPIDNVIIEKVTLLLPEVKAPKVKVPEKNKAAVKSVKDNSKTKEKN